MQDAVDKLIVNIIIKRLQLQLKGVLQDLE